MKIIRSFIPLYKQLRLYQRHNRRMSEIFRHTPISSLSTFRWHEYCPRPNGRLELDIYFPNAIIECSSKKKSGDDDKKKKKKDDRCKTEEEVARDDCFPVRDVEPPPGPKRCPPPPPRCPQPEKEEDDECVDGDDKPKKKTTSPTDPNQTPLILQNDCVNDIRSIM